MADPGARKESERLQPGPKTRGVLSRIAARHAAARGLDTAPLKSEAGLPADLENDPDAWIGGRSQIAFLNLLAEALGDGLFGFHLALELDPRELGPLYYVMASGRTVGEALQREERYTRLISEGLRVHVRLMEQLIVDTEYEGIERHLDRHQIEFWMTCTVRKIRQLSGRQIEPLHTSWMHHRGAEAAEIRSYLGGRVSFDSGLDRLEFSKEVAGYELRTADTYLDAFLLGYADRMVANRHASATDLRTQVENAIAPRLPHGTASQAAVASDLGLGSRTLARRLSEQGMTFREILDAMRMDLATQYLRNEHLSVAQIAWLLGYSKANSFARAYRLRTGRSPRQAR